MGQSFKSKENRPTLRGNPSPKSQWL